MMKSALLFTKTKLHFHIFTDNVDWDEFSSEVGWVILLSPPEYFCFPVTYSVNVFLHFNIF